MKAAGCWLSVLVLTAIVTAFSIQSSLDRYEALQSGWSWDLAYYNQWFWALTKGNQTITVRPIAAYADEGPSVWKMNYLAPIRFVIAPIYAIWPGPRTLLVIHSIVFWWIIPASYSLVRSEARSEWAALAATVLVPATPLLWPLAWNDFREIQLGLPFVLWAIQGYRTRSLKLLVPAVAMLLACRQEFAVIVGSMAILPPRDREDIGRSYRWSQNILLLGACWVLFAFFGYLKLTAGSNSPSLYVEQFGGPKAPLGQTLETCFDFLVVGMGSWAALALLAPRFAVLALPWLWSLSSGKWALRYIGTEQWHHVRYTAPFAILILAAGLAGWARLAVSLRSSKHGRWWLASAWLAAALVVVAADGVLFQRFFGYDPPISREEATEVWTWINQVGPEETVLATYEVTAPLSSRARLFSYILEQNRPRGFPRLAPEFTWAFCRRGDLASQFLVDQGFRLMYDGRFLAIYRREANSPGAKSEKKVGTARTNAGRAVSLLPHEALGVFRARGVEFDRPGWKMARWPCPNGVERIPAIIP